jgi:hypothetical protein
MLWFWILSSAIFDLANTNMQKCINSPCISLTSTYYYHVTKDRVFPSKRLIVFLKSPLLI